MDFDYTKQPGRERLHRDLNIGGEPLVSIVTPFYNGKAYFEQTFRSVLNQTFPWFEWIIVDDGSTDADSMALLDALASLDDRIRVIRQENRGVSEARNTGVKQSAAELFLPLDEDDLIAPTYVETLYWALAHNGDAAWAYTDSCGFEGQEYLWRKPFSAEIMKSENLLVCTALIRKSAFDAVGGYPVGEAAFDEDWLFWLHLLSAGYHPVHVRGWGFWYRRRGDGRQQTVAGNSKLRENSRLLIREAARKVDGEIAAVEYPRNMRTKGYPAPRASAWERRVFSRHEKTHVLMLLPWMEMGGADLFNLDVCSRLDKERFEIGIITTQRGENTWRQRFEDHVTDIFPLPDFLDTENFAEFISYFIRSREVDVLFLSNSYYGYYLVPWLRKEFPDLAIIDYVHMEEWYWRNGGYARVSGAMGEILEKTFVCNERTRQVMIRDFGRSPESVETLYIGVDTETFDPDAVRPGQARERLGISGERPLILFPCRIHPQKRPFLMLEIAKTLKDTLPEAAFAVVGDGPQLEGLKAAVQSEGLEETVLFAGRQKDMRPWYADAALTLICSLKEGLALTAYESLSMGVPVVTSDVGGQAELIDDTVGRVLPLLQREDSDLNSRDFLPEEIRQYADAILEILTDRSEYAKMCAACRRRIREGFSSRDTIRKLDRILSDHAADKRLRETRRETAETLRRVGAYVDDSFGTYERMEAMQAETETLWRDRERYRRLYEEERDLNRIAGGLSPEHAPPGALEARRQLEEIYQMRSWKLIQCYRHFMDATWLGRILSRIRDLFRR